MKKIMLFVAFILGAAGMNAQEIQWMSFEEAVEAQENGDHRPVFIDVYTDWCGWCKRMDAATFKDSSVAHYMNEHFLNVKFDGESRDTVEYKGEKFVFVSKGRRGYHELAAAMLQGKLSYPTVVFFDENFNYIQAVPGYQEAANFLLIAEFMGEGHFRTTPWEEFVANKRPQERTIERVESVNAE
ncbi:MAG: DUF255 domain-containing protein [Flavobacteriia bacterium]|nr:DUF255 domain-containing protein [Flavobacteriia bacterium]